MNKTWHKILNLNPIIIIGVTALVFYLLIATIVNRNYIGPDGRSYQRMAVNLAEGNGFSNKIEPPYEPQFFREPGFPFFFSIACQLNRAIGNENIHLSYESEQRGWYDKSHTEILLLRILQAILATITILLFYKIMTVFLNKKHAFAIAIIFVFYMPFSIFVTYPQRELLVSTLLMGMSFLYIVSAKRVNSIGYDVLFGILAAYLVLTLQAYVFILPIFLISHLMISKSLVKTLKSTAVIAVIFIIGVAPYTYRGYKETNNWRVIKTFGVSYTYEFKKFHDVNAKAYFMNLDNNAEIFRERVVNGYHEPGKEMFEKSFNGYYTNYADSLMQVIWANTSFTRFDMLKRSIIDIIKVNYRKALVWPLWKPDYRQNISELLSGENKMQFMLSMFLGILIFLISMVGMLRYIWKIWYFLPVFIFHFLMIPLIATEGRRVLPFLPFYFMFFMLFIFSIVSFYKTKRFYNQNLFSH